MTMTGAFVNGVLAMGYAVVGAFFLRFYLRTTDRLFLAFAGAFWLMGLTSALITVLEVPQEEQSPFYLLRLLAFLLIIVAVLAKNLRPKGR